MTNNKKTLLPPITYKDQLPKLEINEELIKPRREYITWPITQKL